MRTIPALQLALLLAPVLSGQTYLLSTIAGQTGVAGYEGSAGQAYFNGPDLAVDGAGNTYVADAGNFRLLRIAANGAITTLAGTGVAGFSGDGGPATAAQVGYIRGVAMSASGDIYIADPSNSRIRKISNGIISTVVGTGKDGSSGDGGPATAAQTMPAELVFDPAGNLYISDTEHSVVRKVNPAGTISTVAGTGTGGYSGDGGPASQAALNYPSGLAVDAAGNLYIADLWNAAIRKVDTSGNISTVATGIQGVYGIAADSAGNLYATAPQGAAIYKIAPGAAPQMIAGTGTPGFSGDGGPATLGEVKAPYGIAADAAGNLFFIDFAIYLRELSPANIFPLLVVNSASQLHAERQTAGEYVTIYWTNIGAQTPASATQVLFNGVPAVVAYADANQANALLPANLAGQAAATLQVKSNGVVSNAIHLSLGPADPGIFTSTGTGTGQGAILNNDSSANAGGNAASAGSTIQIFGTGAGTGLTTSVTIGGQPATVAYSGQAPGSAGLFQVNAVVPAGLTPASGQPITVVFDGAATQAGVTVSVR